MLRSLCHRGFRLLLSVVVIATNGVSPGMTHAHAGGALPHNHVADAGSRPHSHDADDHGHAHRGHAHSHGHKHPHEGSACIEDCVPHTHANFFGLPVTIPAKDGSGSKGRYDDTALKVEVVAAQSDVTPNGLGGIAVPSLAVHTFAVWFSADKMLSIYHPPNANHTVLCDTARLERSGVLLV
jgi:hypothetical protein